MNLEVSLENNDIETIEVIEIYKANGWSSAEKPELLIPALKNSDSIVTARMSGKLVGIGNALSDGYLVVYYPHMLVHPEHQGKGIGRAMMECLQQKYASFQQQILVADGKAIEFYKSLGFKRAGKTEPMWIYDGSVGVRFGSAPPHTYASETNSRSGTKYGGRSKGMALEGSNITNLYLTRLHAKRVFCPKS